MKTLTANDVVAALLEADDPDPEDLINPSNEGLDDLTVDAIYSNRDRNGNCYWAFTAYNPATGKTAAGTVGGGESNLRSAEFALRDRWPEMGEKRWRVTVAGLPIRKWNALTKHWGYAGSSGDDILDFIRRMTV